VTRDFPDIVWSLHNHLYNAMDIFYEMINDTPGRVGPPLERPPEDPVEFWRMMLSGEYEVWSFWENVKTWWDYRHLPNIKLVHFNDLKNDLAGQICELAEFLEIDAPQSTFDAVSQHSTFEWMKANADLVTPMAGDIFEGGAQTFINKGTNKRWKDLLSDEDYQEYVAIAEQKLGSQCAQWVRTGELS